MQNIIQSKFLELYRTKPSLYRASGRVNIIGEHTDYNQGFALPMCIDRSMYYAMAENSSHSINLFAHNRSEHTTIDLNEVSRPSNQWSAYFTAIVARLLYLKYPIGGLDVVFGGDIPMGAGLSSSAALCCGFISGLNDIFQLQLSNKKIAVLAQEAEHELGLQCGLLDQYAIVFGKANHALFIDFENHQVLPTKMELDADWLLIDSKIEHNLVEDSSYNDRRSSCERVVHMLSKEDKSINSLRHISKSLLEKSKDKLELTDYKRALFIIEENQRVNYACTAIIEENAKRLGQLMYDSHRGQSELYTISTPEIDYLITHLKKCEFVYGARMTGGGFGGCIICLVKKGKTEEVKKLIENLPPGVHLAPISYDILGSDGIVKLEEKIVN